MPSRHTTIRSSATMNPRASPSGTSSLLQTGSHSAVNEAEEDSSRITVNRKKSFESRSYTKHSVFAKHCKIADRSLGAIRCHAIPPMPCDGAAVHNSTIKERNHHPGVQYGAGATTGTPDLCLRMVRAPESQMRAGHAPHL